MKIDNKLWTVILVVSVFFIIHGISTSGSEDKKMAQAGQTETTIGTGGLIAFAFKKQLIWYAIPAIVGGALLLGPTIITSWVNLFTRPAIPGWVYLVGFALIFLMISKKD